MKKILAFCRLSRLRFWQALALLIAGIVLALFFMAGGVYLMASGDIGGISYILIGPFIAFFAAFFVSPNKVEAWLAKI